MESEVFKTTIEDSYGSILKKDYNDRYNNIYKQVEKLYKDTDIENRNNLFQSLKAEYNAEIQLSGTIAILTSCLAFITSLISAFLSNELRSDRLSGILVYSGLLFIIFIAFALLYFNHVLVIKKSKFILTVIDDYEKSVSKIS